MTEEEKPIREEEDFMNAMAYHSQLLCEIMSLFKIYCGMCGEHATEMEPAMARAIFFTIFGSIEASLRVLAAGTLFVDVAPEAENDPSDSKTRKKLTESEKQFLRQESEELSPRDWNPRQRTKYVSFQDALIGYPTIYARLFGIDLSIDKSCSKWQDFMKLKQLRDIGAHGNSNELRNSPESMRILYKDIKRLLECRLWYCKQLENLPWIMKVNAKGEIDFLNRLLEAGFSETCRRIRGERYAQQDKFSRRKKPRG